MSKLFDNALKNVPKETKRFVDHSFDIVDQIHEILERQGKSQRDLAIMLDKRESEISKWMRGTHNFTIKSIAKIEVVLGERIVTTPRKSTGKPYFIPVVVSGTYSKRTIVKANSSSNVEWQKSNQGVFKRGLKVA